jgi:hypothetical protein
MKRSFVEVRQSSAGEACLRQRDDQWVAVCVEAAHNTVFVPDGALASRWAKRLAVSIQVINP